MKNKRVKKIKSKLYHKLKKKDRQRKENQLLSELDKIDSEAAKEYRHKQEQKLAEERLRQRH